MLLGVLGCIDFTMSLSKSLMWHILIGWCKPKGLHAVLIEFNLFLKTLSLEKEMKRIKRKHFLKIGCRGNVYPSIFTLWYIINKKSKGTTIK